MNDYKLKDEFVNKYKKVKPSFGFNGLGELVYRRTYSRKKENGEKEQWYETIRRVVEGTYSIQKEHINKYGLGWDECKAHKSAEEMYDRMFNMKFLPPGRGLWSMNTPVVTERKIFSALNNCAFVSTDNITTDLSKPFEFMMDMSMVGVGVGFDVEGKNKLKVKNPVNKEYEKPMIYDIPDTREGWVYSLRLLLRAYFAGEVLPVFRYGLIRPKGSLIRGFGGIASGPEPLMNLHTNIKDLLKTKIGKYLSATDITDIMNLIGVCVVAGNVRRTAQIVLGDPNDEEYLKLKDYEWDSTVNEYVGDNSHRAKHGWASNNSITAELGMDYSKVAEQTSRNGEPGYVWLENAQHYGRLKDTYNGKDIRAKGVNPSLRKGTKVWTTRGIKDIETLENTFFEVKTLNGNTAKAKCWLSDPNSILYEVKLEGGHSYFCTKEHKWPIYTPQGYIKSETSDLKPGHLLPITKFNTISENNDSKRGDYSDGFFIGWLTGDGGIHVRKDDNKKQINFIVSSKDNESGIGDILLNKLNSIKDIKSTWRKRKNNLELSTSNNSVITYLTQFGFTGKEHIPTTIWDDWSEEAIKGYIDGLFSSDGSVEYLYKNARIRLTAKNKSLLKDISALLGFYGIKNSIIKRDTNLNNKNFTSYILSISNRTSIDHFKSIFKLSVTHKQNNLDKISPMTTNRITNDHYRVLEVIKTNIKEPVWDIAVNDSTNTFQIPHIITGNCGEQSLESYEMCCLVETFPTRADSKEDYLRTLKFAYLYAKTVTLGKTNWIETNRVQLRNRRIGTSASGIAQFIGDNGLNELKTWLEEGYDKIQYYDKIYSEWLAVPKSIKTTSVKPSGTVSLLAGVTPGVHYPESNYYIRRMRLSNESDLLNDLQKANYNIEVDVNDPDNTVVVEIPIAIENVRTLKDVSIWEQMELAACMQYYWADNQVSCTVTFKDNEKDQIDKALNYFQYRLKGISFLPKLENTGKYKQMPYEEITKEKYEELYKKLKPLKIKENEEVTEIEKFCDGDSCIL